MPATCIECGGTIRAGDLFCAACGSSVARLQGAATTAPSGPTGSWPASNEDASARLLDDLRAATIGEYDIAGELGRGGMACVYLAHDITLDRKVAIKVMLPAITQQPGMLERFLQEAKTAAKLGHPNIIPIYGARRAGDTLFFVMKFVDGRPLDSIIAELGPLPLDLTRTMFGQVARALDYAHRHHVIHRDVKPANVMVDREGFAVVTDFGIAKLVEAPGVTVSGSVLGTPYYMSPEQAEGSLVTGAADQYSLGVMAYEMLTGRRPFQGNSLVSLILAHREDAPPPIRELRPDCPPHIEVTVNRMLAKHPDDRFPSLRAAADAFISGANDDDGQVRTVMMTLAKSNPRPIVRVSTPRSPILPRRTASGLEEQPVKRMAPPPAPSRPRARGALVGGVLAVGVVAGALYLADVGGLAGGAAAVAPDTATRRTQAAPDSTSPRGPSQQYAAELSPVVGTPPTADTTRPASGGASRLAPRGGGGRGEPGADQVAVLPQPTGATVAPLSQLEEAWFRLGTRLDSIPVVLFVNGANRSVVTSPRFHSAPSGRVRIELRATGCAAWDTTFTMRGGDSARIGYRSPRCGQGDE